MFVLVLAFLLLWSPVAPAAASTSTQTKLSALASFSWLSKKRCVSTTVSITAWDVREGDGSGDRVSDPPLNRTDPPAIYVAISKENQCTGELLMSGSAVVPYADDEFSESPNLKRANLDVSFSIDDIVTGTSVPVALSVQFHGVGPGSQTLSDSTGGDLAPGETQGVLGQEQSATAVGSIVIGSEKSRLSRTGDSSLLLYQYEVGI